MTKDVWIYTESLNGKVAPVVGQLISKAKAITDASVVAVVLQAPGQDLSAQLTTYGPDRILVAEHAAFAQAGDVCLATGLAALAEQYQPNTILFGATPLGRSLAPRAQAKLLTGLTADCLDLYFDEDLLVAVKPSYGDNVMCEITCPDARPQMASVRPNTFAAKPVVGAKPEIVRAAVTLSAQRQVTVVENRLKVAKQSGIAQANKVLALGRGAASDAQVELARTVAAQLGASVGVSRPLTDRADFTVEQQIGQSGTTIAPDFLLNLGISGAVQYQVGIDNAKLIVSANKDADAPIMSQSDYVYVGDAAALLKALSKRM